MNRNAIRKGDRRSQIDDDLAFLHALQMAIVECRIAIDQSRTTIESTFAAIKLLDQLDGRSREAARSPQGSEPTC